MNTRKIHISYNRKQKKNGFFERKELTKENENSTLGFVESAHGQFM